jgi:tubulin monoglycylase TTLL3/8
MDPNDQAF